MRFIYISIFLFFLSFLYSCCNCKPTNQTLPTSIVQNLSIVTARVDEVLFKDETDYQLKVMVLFVEKTAAYPSIAVSNNEYLLTPNFRYDNDKLMNSEVNESLKKLGKLSKGKEFKAEISLENQRGWFIQKVLSLE